MNNRLYYCSEQIVWQEVPQHTALAFMFSGCPLHCHGCHSADTWREGMGKVLELVYLQERLARYQGLISCVLFMGGEWRPQALLELLQAVKAEGLSTCLYTGLTLEELQHQVSALLPYLDYVKTGRWRSELGGLNSPNTNQCFIHLPTGNKLNHLFLSAKHIATNH